MILDLGLEKYGNITFSEGKTELYHIVIGADGVHSKMKAGTQCHCCF